MRAQSDPYSLYSLVQFNDVPGFQELRLEFGVLDQKSKEIYKLLKGINYAGRCPKRPGQVSLRAMIASRKHAELIINHDNTVLVYDVGSSNGTYINNVKIVPFIQMPVVVNDVIGFGVGDILPIEITPFDVLPVFRLVLRSPTPPPSPDNLFLEKMDPDMIERIKKELIKKMDFQTINVEMELERMEQDEFLEPCKKENKNFVQKMEITKKEEDDDDDDDDDEDEDEDEDEDDDDDDADDGELEQVNRQIEIPPPNCTLITDITPNTDSVNTNSTNAPMDVEDTEIKEEIIDLSDDDDEDVILSQAAFSNEPKQAESVSETIYLHIKQELDNIGLNTSSYIPTVDLTGEDDGPFQWLEDSLQDTHDDPKHNETASNCTENIEQHAKTNYDWDEDIDEEEDCDDDTLSSSSDSDSAANEQHFQQRRNKDRVSSKKLKPGSNFIESRVDTKGIRMELTKRHKLNKRKKVMIRPVNNVDLLTKEIRSNIQKERKEKLKSLCAAHVVEEVGRGKQPGNPILHEIPENTHKAPAKVKVSKGRGGFLCEGAAAEQTTKYIIPPIVEAHHIPKKRRIAHNRAKSTKKSEKSGVASTSHVISPSQLRIPPIDIQTANPLQHLNKHAIFTAPLKPILSVQPNKQKQSSRSVTAHLSTLFIQPSNQLLPPSSVISPARGSMTIHPAVRYMISWPSRSFNDYHGTKTGAIPGIPEDNVGILPHTKSWYLTFEQYKSTMYPLMAIESWMNVYEDWCKIGNSPEFFRAKIDHIDFRSTYTAIKCKTYISSRDANKIMFRKKVLLIVSLPIMDPQNALRRSFMQLVTYIHHVEKRPVRNTDEIPHGILKGRPDFALYMTLLTKSTSIKVDHAKFIKCDFVSYVSNTMKLFDAVHQLRSSPLLNVIINPNLEDYDITKYVSYDAPICSEVTLNESQHKAVLETSFVCTSRKPSMYLLDGPPGTGKTTVIIQLLKQLFSQTASQEQTRVLLVAPSNGAIDNLMLKIMDVKNSFKNRKNGLKVIRVGLLTQIHPEVKSYSIDEAALYAVTRSICRENPAYRQEYESLKQKLKILKAKKGFHADDPEFIAKLNIAYYALENFARNKLGRSFYSLLSREKYYALNNCDVICSTLSSCYRLTASGDLPLIGRLKCCIVDEATQSVEQDTLIPLLLGIKKLILVGDPQQLPAVTSSSIARSHGYGQSLFARIKLRLTEQMSAQFWMPNDDIVRFLDTQYRMHPHISLFPNNAFYNGRLKNAANLALPPSTPPTPIPSPPSSSTQTASTSCANSFLQLFNLIPNQTYSNSISHTRCPPPLWTLRPYMVIRQSERDLFPSQQYGNQSEVELVLGLYREIAKLVNDDLWRAGKDNRVFTVGIITPYNKQRELIEAGIKRSAATHNNRLNLTVSTVDGVQGQEKDIVIISNVRVSGNSFIENENRMNVALTRAKHVLYIVGSDNLFEESNLFKEIERDALSRNLQATIPNSAFIRDVIFKN